MCTLVFAYHPSLWSVGWCTLACLQAVTARTTWKLERHRLASQSFCASAAFQAGKAGAAWRRAPLRPGGLQGRAAAAWCWLWRRPAAHLSGGQAVSQEVVPAFTTRWQHIELLHLIVFYFFLHVFPCRTVGVTVSGFSLFVFVFLASNRPTFNFECFRRRDSEEQTPPSPSCAALPLHLVQQQVHTRTHRPTPNILSFNHVLFRGFLEG